MAPIALSAQRVRENGFVFYLSPICFQLLDALKACSEVSSRSDALKRSGDAQSLILTPSYQIQ